MHISNRSLIVVFFKTSHVLVVLLARRYLDSWSVTCRCYGLELRCMQTFLKTEDVTELYMVVMLCVSSLKPICGANSSLPSICFVALRALHAAEANRVTF